ncbi:MAG: uroporphyrinogen decarboxylase [Anaerolineae bacterium]|nr:uroporphyrinogen decarboxylase [Anaerolineae bacterium]
MSEHATPSAPAAPPDLSESRFLRACRRQPVDAMPVWLMRQAGRYMSEYRALRERYGILDIIKAPELAREVTLQPLDAFDLDAAILFSDILLPLEVMGYDLAFVKGDGPVIGNPTRTLADVVRLKQPDLARDLGFTFEAIRLIREATDRRGIPLIGFAGAPFTLASYAVEGGGSKNRVLVKSLMWGQPETWHALMSQLADVTGHYLLMQAQAGAHALQVFDSWVGELSPDDYRRFVMPYTAQAIAIARGAGVPIIHFGTGTSSLLELMRDAGGDVIGVDWRTPLDVARQRLGDGVATQGNLDPVALFAPWESVRDQTRRILDSVRGQAGHIFNLGHGILPQTPVETVRRLVEFVHDDTRV